MVITMGIQEDMDKKYENNLPVVEKIAELFGLRILSFNPGWRFEPIYDEVWLGQYRSYEVPNDFLGKLALILGYEWEFDYNDEEVGKEIAGSEAHVRNLQLRSEEAIESHEHILDLIKDTPESDERKSEIKNSMKSIQESNKGSLDDAEKYLAKKKKVLEIRDRLKSMKIRI